MLCFTNPHIWVIAENNILYFFRQPNSFPTHHGKQKIPLNHSPRVFIKCPELDFSSIHFSFPFHWLLFQPQREFSEFVHLLFPYQYPNHNANSPRRSIRGLLEQASIPYLRLHYASTNKEILCPLFPLRDFLSVPGHQNYLQLNDMKASTVRNGLFPFQRHLDPKQRVIKVPNTQILHSFMNQTPPMS